MEKTLHGILFLIFFVVFCRDAVSSQFETYLPEEMNFDAIFSDIPPDFDFSTATLSSFENLPFVTTESAEKMITLRDSLSSEYMLKNYNTLSDLSPMEYAILKHLSIYSKKSPVSELSGSLRQGYVHNPQSENINDSKYYLKSTFSPSRNLFITCIGERDANEPRAFDFFSANVAATFDNERIKLIIGDYRHGFGQGLLFSRYGRNYGDGTGIMLHDISRVANTSFDETLFSRGSHITISRKWITTQVWYSYRKLDATLDESGDAVTIRDTGYHLSGSVRNNLKEQIFGARFKTEPMNGLSCAVAGALSYYSPSLSQKEGEQNYFDPEGSMFHHLSFDGTFRRRTSTVFIEHVREGSRDHASIGGITVHKGDVKTSLVLRYFSEGYFALRSGAFNAFGATSNEKGIYSSIQTNLPYRTKLMASVDLARTLYRRTTALLPESGQRVNVVISRPFKNYVNTLIGYRSTDKDGSGIRRWNCRTAVENRSGAYNKLFWQSLIAWTEANENGGPYAESSVEVKGADWKGELIGAFFDIPSYDSRYYRYENNVPGIGYTLPVWGRGGTVILVAGYGPFSVRYRYCESDMMGQSQQMTLQLDIIF